MNEPLFSERHGIVIAPPSMDRESIPTWLRREIFRGLRETIEDSMPPVSRYDAQRAIHAFLRPLIWKRLEKEPRGYESYNHDNMWALEVYPLSDHLEWWEFLDVVEEAYRVLIAKNTSTAILYMLNANKLLAREFVPWVLSPPGKVDAIRPAEIAEQVAKSHGLLATPGFEGPRAQFTNANDFLSKRPKPDGENAAKEAVGALEAVAKIVAGDEKATLSTLLKTYFRGRIPPTLTLTLEKLYAYRGATDGVSHGKTGDDEIPQQEVEWVFGMCAVSINYLMTTR